MISWRGGGLADLACGFSLPSSCASKSTRWQERPEVRRLPARDAESKESIGADASSCGARVRIEVAIPFGLGDAFLTSGVPVFERTSILAKNLGGGILLIHL